MQKDMDLMELLHRLDDPHWLEWPTGYDSSAAAVPFDRLVSRLDSDFSTRCEVDQNIQDSAQYGRIDIPAQATVCGTNIVVLVSKFRPLAMVAADNPGAFFGTADACTEGELHVGDLEKVEQALVALGYVVIPEELLTNRYDGVANLSSHGSGPPSWWDRFFGSF
jgi:hypothetical protein